MNVKSWPTEWLQWHSSCIFIINFEQISYIALVFSIIDFELGIKKK